MSGQPDEFARIARDATIAFRAQKYEEALTLLRRLSELRGASDPRVQHNIAVAQYYAGIASEGAGTAAEQAPAAEAKGTQQNVSSNLLSAFDDVLALPPRKLDAIRPASPEHLPSSPDPLLSSTPELDDANAFISSPTGPDSDSESPDSAVPSVLENATILYNRAVTLFYIAHYDGAADVLEPILQTVETVDAHLGLRSCLLAAECRLAASRSKDALTVASTIERAFVLDRSTSDSVGQDFVGGPDGLGVSKSLFDSLAASSANAHLQLPDQGEGGDEQHARFTPSPDRFEERWSDGGSDSVMSSPARSSKGRLSNGLGTGNVSMDSTAAENGDDAIPSLTTESALSNYEGSVKAAVAMIRARAYLMSGNISEATSQVESGRAAIRAETGNEEAEGTEQPPSPDAPTHNPFAFVQAQIDHHRSSTAETLSSLERTRNAVPAPSWASFVEDTDADGVVSPWDEKYYLNNVGCVHHRAGKHAAAAMCFADALKMNGKQVEKLVSGAQEEEVEEWEQDLVDEDKNGSVESARPAQPPHLLRYVLDTTAPTLYNFGLQLMLMHKYQQAYECFERAVRWAEARGGQRVGGTGARDFGGAVPPGVPWALIWLRMAECCVRVHEAERKRKRPAKPASIPLGGYRIVITNPRQQRFESPSESTPSESMNMDEALRCYQNALAAADGEVDWTHPDCVAVRVAALVGVAYVALYKGMPLVTLAVANEALKDRGNVHMEGWGGLMGEAELRQAGDGRYGDDLENLRCLARIYATRALTLLARPSEAGTYINQIATKSTELHTAAAFAKASALCAAAERVGADPVGVQAAFEEVVRCSDGRYTVGGEAMDVLRGLRGWVALAMGDRVSAAEIFAGET
ncbi:CCR4-NOT transcription complex subunit 10 [Rhizophlyctis rosea]|nr:CCR4-NOT transcription complex subunit 10 [Rhizophlyctis rosea]